jgi:hypothetical protein
VTTATLAIAFLPQTTTAFVGRVKPAAVRKGSAGFASLHPPYDFRLVR